MKNYTETKIGRIIEEEFDSRMENAVFGYIFDTGANRLKELTEKDILKIEGNALMTADFVQALVRCAVRIVRECSYSEIIEYIRIYLFCEPKVNEVYLYKYQFNKIGFDELLGSLNLGEDDVKGDYLKIYAVVDEDSLESEE